MNAETILFQTLNRQKLRKIGVLPSKLYQIEAIYNKDGTITAVNKVDKKRVNEINKVTLIIKKEIVPLIDYIKKNIFKNKDIMSQELVVNEEDNVMAKCDLSTDDAILEIKSFNSNIDNFKYQLYYESNNRDIYILQTFWKKRELYFKIYKVDPIECSEEEMLKKRLSKYQYKIALKSNVTIQILSYTDDSEKVTARCLLCKHEWTNRRADNLMERCYCPICKIRC